MRERLAANLTVLFTELPMLERFAAAARAGFRGAEILFPYQFAPADLANAASAAGIEMVLINTPPANWAGGARGFAAQPKNEALFRRDFDRAAGFARAVRARHVHVMAGVADGPQAYQTFRANLEWATKRAPDLGLTIEPICAAVMPGYFLNDFDLAARIIDEVAAPNLGLQFDAYHAHVITGDVLLTWQRHVSITRHVQISGHPGRHEPVGGDIDYPAFFRALRDAEYDGWISAEYQPAGRTESGLGWIPQR